MSNGTTPDNNTANALNDSFHVNGQFANQFGSWIGAIADWGGAWGAISGLVSTLISIFNSQNGNDPLKPIKDELKKQFALISASQKATNIINKWNSVKTDIAPAESVLDSLPTLVTGLPFTPFEIAQQLEPCTTPLHDLGYDQFGQLPAWTAVYSDQIYWTDAGLYKLLTYQQKEDGTWVQSDWIDVGLWDTSPAATVR